MKTWNFSPRSAALSLAAAACILLPPPLLAAGSQSQTITFNAIPAQSVGTSLTLSATASSGLPVTFTVVQNGNCSVSGSVVTFLNVGNCGIIANQAGNSTYAAAPAVGQIVAVNPASAGTFTLSLATTTITLQPNNGVADALTVNDSNGFTGAVTLSITGAPSGVGGSFYPSNPATGNTNLVVYVPAGTAPGSYPLTITGVSGSLTVTTAATLVVQGTQTITFPAIAAQTVGTPLTLTATSSSGLAVTYTSSTTAVCTVSGATATFIAAGTCTLTASQSGNNVYSAAPSVSQSFTVAAATPTAQTITFPAIAAQTVGTPLTLTATASSNLAVTYTSSTTAVCTVSGTTATFIAAGTCTITASQPGNATYAAATPVSQSFNVAASTTLPSQTITFANPGAQTVGAPIALSATASSGLSVTFSSSTPSICTVSGTAANFAAAGTCTLTAAQPGNASYAAATSVTQSFSITGTAAPVSGYFTICQAQPTGSYCTDANPGPADGNGYHDLPYWTNLNKVLTSIAVSDNQVWGVDRSGVLWFLPNFKTSTAWIQVATNVTQVSAGHNLVCQIAGNQHTLCGASNPVTGAVTWVDTGATNLKQIAASAGKQFWAVDTSGNLIQVKDYTQLSSTSTYIAAGVQQVAVDGRGVVCQVNSNQSVYCSNWSAPPATANPAPYHSLSWVQANTQLQNISVVEGQVLGADSSGNLWLLQDWANSATWFKIAFGGAGTVMAGASVPSQFLPADFAPGEVPVLMFMGQSNSVGDNELIPRFISPTYNNVWGVQNAGWNFLPGNQNGASPVFTNAISTIASIQWTNFNITANGPDMDLGYNYNVSGVGPGDSAANFAAYQWQGLINAGWPLPDLYVIHIAWPGEGLDPADNQGSTAGIPFAVHGLALWQPTLTSSQEPSYALAPFARTIVYRALQNLLAAGKTPRIINLQWNQWETDAEFATAIADAPTNYSNLIGGFYTATGINFPIQFVKPLSTNYGTTQLAQMQTVFANLVANDPTDLSEIDISTVSSTIFSGGIFGGGDGSVHYNFDTQNWFSKQAIGTCLLNANCGIKITTLPSSPPN